MFNLIFDTETTGLPKQWSAPLSDTDNWPRLVQISWILTDGTFKKEFDFIIKPEGFIIPDHVAEIHGITTEIANEKGIDLKSVLGVFLGFLAASDVVVAHNIDFDKSIIGAEYARMGILKEYMDILAKKRLFCTMKESMVRGSHGGGNKWPKLKELYYHMFGEDFSGAHNSLYDTRACARCYQEMTKND